MVCAGVASAVGAVGGVVRGKGVGEGEGEAGGFPGQSAGAAAVLAWRGGPLQLWKEGGAGDRAGRACECVNALMWQVGWRGTWQACSPAAAPALYFTCAACSDHPALRFCPVPIWAHAVPRRPSQHSLPCSKLS